MMPSYPQRQQRYIQLTGYNKRGKRTGKAKSAFYSLLEGFQADDLHRKYTHTHTQHYNYLRSLIVTHTHTSPRFMYIYIRISITISVYSTFANEYALNFTSLPQQLSVPSKIYPCINICILLPLLLFLSLSLSLLQPGCLVSSLSRPSFP